MLEVSTESANKDDTQNGPSSVNVLSPVDIQGNNLGVQITIVKLDGTNYIEWSQSAKMYIHGRGKLCYVNGWVVEPSTSNVSTSGRDGSLRISL